MNAAIEVAPQVREALGSGAVVALESTIIAHGLPYPANLEVASALEAAVRDAGAVPATIAVVAGKIRVGLPETALEQLARHGERFVKCGAADLAPVLARGGDGATTVSATAVVAARVGIRLFATGGIGGVHRGDAGDVSSDLSTLARVPVAVVSAGAKAILDVPRTAEMLESLGVLLLGYRTDELPAFYSRRSGVMLEHRVDDPAAAAAMLSLRWDALGQGGVLLANPIPAAAALDAALIESAIDDALRAAAAASVRGKALTPFLLQRLAAATRGEAVAANRALAVHNAEVAGTVACAYAALRRAG